ncbi:MAG: carboxylesterase family protein [Acidobacteriota bacterium]|nr:carboxylesterase family protein [Acidobacteriota bacterium]MDE3266232.1 carboxylesterase family protein [Acidobacteriota bacterium]
MKTRSTAFLALAFPLLLACAAEPSDPFLVQTDAGPVQGFAPESSDDIAVFLGIPFAQAPEGHLRWRPPVAVEPWTEPLQANEYRPICPQGRAQLPQSEDCLYLNVWTAAERSDSDAMPVMVWIHGGGFRAGNGRLGEAPATGRGAGLASRGVVVVSIQYRLGALGFFAHPALAAEAAASGEPEGSHGVLDMIAALEWVQQNAAAFGGDADRVTIFGVSAGGMAVNTLMSTPASAGLFHRAIAQSGYGTWRLPHLSEARWGLPSARDHGAALFAGAGFALGDEPSADDLRSVPFEDLNALGTGFWVPITGTVLPDEPGIVFARGEQHDVPYITGGNSFEGTIFRAFAMAPDDFFTTFGQREQKARNLYGADGETEEDTERIAAATLFGDQRYVISARYLAAQMKNVSSPARTYYFRFVPEAQRETFPGAPHGSEVSYAFGDPGVPDSERYPGADGEALADSMAGYWTRFAATGDPNGDGAPEWPEYDEESDTWMVLDAPEPEATPGVLKDKLDLLEAVYLERVGGE